MTQQTAQGLAALGRGPDSMLVHMAPNEVAGLQALALKSGGSLTINPDTGLPEAGFLSKILPMVLGAGAMMIPGLQGLGAGWIGAGIGGLQALATGSLKKGLMAGLGAYGGAGLAGSLMGAGTGALSSAAGAGAEIPASAVVPEAVAPTVAPDSLANAVSAPSAAAPAGMQPLAGVPGKFVTSALPQPVVPPINAAQIAPTITQAPVAASAYAPAESMGAALARDQAAAQAVGSKLATTTPMDTLGAGFKAVTASPSTALNFAKDNMYSLGAAGIAALDQDPKAAPEDTPGMIRPYTYSREKVPGAFEDVADAPMSSKERRYFADKYTALTPYKAPGPEYMASGGPVEDMSNANAIGMNTGYPQADIGVGAYATPYQQPINHDVVMGSQFAGGGSINLQGTFDMGGGQGGQRGGSNNPQPFIGNNDAPSMMPAVMPQQGSTPTPGNESARMQYDMMPQPAVVGYKRPSFEQYLAQMGPMSRGIAFAGGGSVSPNGGSSSNGMLARLFAQANGQSGGSIGGYTYDPVTQTYSKIPGDDVASNAVPSSGGLSGSIGGYTYNPTTQMYGREAVAESTAAMARGGISHLGDYSDGGRLLRGPGDGISDSIPATIGKKRPARLADGEFVVPARIVSELGNGSTEAGARKLYAMMDRVQKARGKTVGKGKVAANSNASKYLPT